MILVSNMNKRFLIALFVILTWAYFISSGTKSGLMMALNDGYAQGTRRQKVETINLNLTGVSLKNTLQLLCNRLGKNLLLDPAVDERRLNMSLTNITPMEAFAAILEASDLGYKDLEGNVLYVANSEKIGKQTIVRQIKVKYANAAELQKILSNVVVSEFGTVMADERTNTLVIKESPDVIARMVKLIVDLDKPVKQVYIQGAIVEVSSTNDTETGVEWLWKDANFKSFKGQIGTDFSIVSGTQTTGETPSSDVSLQYSDEIPFPVGTGLGIGILNSSINSVLHFLKASNNLNLLSRPRVTTLDNQESVIEVGDQIPFKVLNQFGVTSFEFKDATIQLLVKPHVIDSQFVMLQVSPKADFQNGVTPDGQPIIATRKASTTVKVRNGQTIVIGGLIRDSIISTEKKVPILGSIPVLGFFFKSTKATKIKTELIVFLTPLILDDQMNSRFFEKDFRFMDKVRKKLK